MSSIELRPIGVVRSPLSDATPPACKADFGAVEATIELRKELSDGLRGIERCANLWVIWHFDRADAAAAESARRVRPHGDPTRAEVGVFATCCPKRPNRLALSRVALVSVDHAAASLVVRGLDAVDGTPVIDIKPEIVRH